LTRVAVAKSAEGAGWKCASGVVKNEGECPAHGVSMMLIWAGKKDWPFQVVSVEEAVSIRHGQPRMEAAGAG